MSVSKAVLRLAARNDRFRRRLIAAMSAPKLISTFIVSCCDLDPKRWLGPARNVGIDSAEEGFDREGSLAKFVRDWGFENLTPKEVKLFEKMLERALKPLDSTGLSYDLEVFPDRGKLEAQITFEGASYSIDPNDPSSQIESVSQSDDFTDDIERFFKVRLKPHSLRVNGPRIKNTHYDDLQVATWKVIAEWDLSQYRLEPPKSVVEAFLDGFDSV